MNSKTVLILGAGIMQIPSIEAAKAEGWKVVTADANASAPGIPLCDGFVHIDLKDRDAIAAEAARMKAECGLDAVFTAGTDFSSTVAYAAEKAGLPGIGFETAMKASDKALMRQTFLEHGVSSPSFFRVGSVRDAEAGIGALGFPVVVKPVDSMGARGVRRVNAAADLPSAVETALAGSASGHAIIEEYIEGPEFSIDALVQNGRITICGFADRHIFFPPYFIEMGHTMPSDCTPEIESAVIEEFRRGVRAIGIENGAAKGDVKYSVSGRKAFIGEIAARLSGGFMSGWTYPYSSGINLHRAALRVAAGLPAGNLEASVRRFSAERACISIPGIVSEISGAEEAAAVPGVTDVFVSRSPGDRLYFPVNNVQKVANFISAADDRASAVSAAEEAASKVFVRLMPGDSQTRDFIERKTFGWAPDAFRLESPKNIEALDSMNGTGRMLPDPDSEKSAEWHGIAFGDALARVLNLTGASESELTSGFWNAFIRGGIQGGVWYLETEGRR